MSFFIERALAVVYENRWFLEKTRGRSVKELLSFAVSLAVCRYWDFDALSVLLVKDRTVLWGHLITAAVVAGGSKASIKLFQDVLDIKSNAERERLAIIEAERKALAEKARVQVLVQGKTERDPARAARLSAARLEDAASVPGDLTDRFEPLDVDGRTFALRELVEREGQGAFRLRLLGAYDGRCAITGEHTGPVLDAAHIQPYLGPRSNHIQNGLLLTKEFHALFDQGYVGITPDYEIRVSDRLRADWNNGRRYYPYNGQRLQHVPTSAASQPSRDALAWHLEHVFKRTG